jgi:hypothetical protein
MRNSFRIFSMLLIVCCTVLNTFLSQAMRRIALAAGATAPAIISGAYCFHNDGTQGLKDFAYGFCMGSVPPFNVTALCCMSIDQASVIINPAKLSTMKPKSQAEKIGFASGLWAVGLPLSYLGVKHIRRQK